MEIVFKVGNIRKYIKEFTNLSSHSCNTLIIQSYSSATVHISIFKNNMLSWPRFSKNRLNSGINVLILYSDGISPSR